MLVTFEWPSKTWKPGVEMSVLRYQIPIYIYIYIYIYRYRYITHYCSDSALFYKYITKTSSIIILNPTETEAVSL